LLDLALSPLLRRARLLCFPTAEAEVHFLVKINYKP
jgi:hypothetical protein